MNVGDSACPWQWSTSLSRARQRSQFCSPSAAHRDFDHSHLVDISIALTRQLRDDSVQWIHRDLDLFVEAPDLSSNLVIWCPLDSSTLLSTPEMISQVSVHSPSDEKPDGRAISRLQSWLYRSPLSANGQPLPTQQQPATSRQRLDSFTRADVAINQLSPQFLKCLHKFE